MIDMFYIQTAILLLSFLGIAVYIYKWTKFSKLIKGFRLTPFSEVKPEFLKELPNLTLESKLRVIQSCLGHQVRFWIDVDRDTILIRGSFHYDLSMKDLAEQDKSIG